MKGTTGIIVAVLLALVAAGANWLYMTSQGNQYEQESFVALREPLNAGERLEEEHLERHLLPADRTRRDLREAFVQWDYKETVVGQTLNASYEKGDLILWQDLESPGNRTWSAFLKEGEVAKGVPVDSRTFVASRVDPGDYVSFTVRTFGTNSGTNSQDLAATETLGPFEILGIGSRTGGTEIYQASGRSRGPENIITIRIGNSDQKAADRLFALLRASGYQGAEVTIHAPPDE